MRRAQSFSTKRAASSAGRMARPMSWGTIAGACWAQSLRSSGTKPRAYCSGKSRLIICDAEPACQWIDVDLLHSAMLLTDERYIVTLGGDCPDAYTSRTDKPCHRRGRHASGRETWRGKVWE